MNHLVAFVLFAVVFSVRDHTDAAKSSDDDEMDPIVETIRLVAELVSLATEQTLPDIVVSQRTLAGGLAASLN